MGQIYIDIPQNKPSPTKRSSQSQITEKAQQSLQQTKKTPAKKSKPPPIIIDGVILSNAQQKELCEDLKKYMHKGFQVKYTKKSTIIYPNDVDEYKKYVQILDERTAKNDITGWHTYALPEGKTHAFIIKGLDHQPEIQELVEELQEHKVDVRSIHPMNTRYRMLHLVVTGPQTTLASLQKIHFLNNVKISWERRQQTRDLLQCKNCCMWGHATSNCRRAPRCNNCAEQHRTTTCQIANEFKCSNCNGQHRASDTQCPVYKFKQDQIKAQQLEQIPKKYFPAPAPTTNAWQSGRATSTGGGRASAPQTPRTATKDFPQLPNRGQQRQQTNNQVRVLDNYESENETQTSAGGIQELFQNMKQLSTMCNFAELNRFVKDLMVVMSNPDSLAKAMGMIEFLETKIHSYKI